jgi:hypothetical protein
MPRPAGNSYFVLLILLILPFTGLTAISTAASQTPPPGGVSHQALGGIWVLNRDRGDAPGAVSGPDGSDGAGRRGGGQGVSGRVGRGGQGRGFGGDGEAQREDDMARRQAVMNYVRAATESPKQLTIVVHDASVSITDVDGHVQLLQIADNKDKKIEERAENGLIKLSKKNHWDGATLVSEVDIEGGPKIIRTYALSPGGTELRLTTAVDGQGRPVNLIRLYERPVESR